MFLKESFKPDWKWARCLLVCVAVVSLLISFARKELDCSQHLLSATNMSGAQHLAPGGCVLKHYSSTDAGRCFQNVGNETTKMATAGRKILFVGGWEIEALRLAFLQQLKNENQSAKESAARDEPDAKFEGSEQAAALRTKFIYRSSPNSGFRNLLKKWTKKSFVADLIVVGVFPSCNATVDSTSVDFLIANVSSLVFELDLVSEKTPLFWLIPSPDTQPESALCGQYKRKFHSILKQTHVKLWETKLPDKFFSEDKKNMKYNFDLEVQVLNNYFCNKRQIGPLTLCCTPQNTTLFEIYVFLVAVIVLSIVAFCMTCIIYYWKDGFLQQIPLLSACRKTDSQVELPVVESKTETQENFSHVYLFSLVKCAVIFGYFFICDRTNLLEKANKSFTYEAFYIPVAIGVAVALVSQDKSSSSKPLGREMTDEWKGWMQILILIYHYTGASSQLYIYMHMRILVSAYLLLTGYGNFYYYWEGGKLTFRRYCQVMLRMNLLTIVLCLVMKRPYQFYYFVPLVSFCYTVLFVLLTLPPWPTLTFDGVHLPSNKDYLIAVIKLITLFGLITSLTLSKRVSDALFLVPIWRFMFEIPGHGASEWWFRWRLDRYSILYGAVLGLVWKYMSQHRHSEEDCEKRSPWRILFSASFGIGLTASYLSLSAVCSTKRECNAFHPFIVWIPILGYILLRNLTERLRLYHSVVMAKVGKISLELFVCQYHILLASDTRGTLVLVPCGHPAINVVVTSLLFVCVANELHNITAEVVRALVPKENKKIAKNLVSLLAIFIAMKCML